MNKQGLITMLMMEKISAEVERRGKKYAKGYGKGIDLAIELIEASEDEPQKPVVPQFVADYIEFKKEQNFHVYGAMRVIEYHYDKRVPDWFYEGNIDTFVRAWLDGYKVEEEHKYNVKFKGISGGLNYLNYNFEIQKWYFASSSEIGMVRTKFTRKELEEAGLGEVFNSPLFEVEEAE